MPNDTPRLAVPGISGHFVRLNGIWVYFNGAALRPVTPFEQQMLAELERLVLLAGAAGQFLRDYDAGNATAIHDSADTLRKIEVEYGGTWRR